MEQPPLFGSGYQCENPDCGAPIHPDNHGHIARHCNKNCNDAAYYAANRDKVAAMYRRWNTANRDKIAAKKARYRAANRDKIAEQQARYRAANPDKIAAKNARYHAANREKRTAQQARYRAANPDKAAAKRNRRRARKAAAVPQRWRKREDVPQTLCYWCGVDLKDAPKHLDHIMPISLGGPATPSNEAMTCPACNLQKSDKHPLVWIAQLVATSTQPTEGKVR